MMYKNKISGNLEFSEIGLGTWAIGGPWKYGWGAQDATESEKSILKAIDEGINWIDTAPAYGLGNAEEVVGRVVKKCTEKIYIATKCGIIWDDNKKVSFSIHPDSIRRECDASLKRLNVDSIDLYQIHWPDSKTPIADSWDQMIQLKASGKVKNIGVCNFDINLLNICRKLGHLATLQPPYSMLQRGIEKKIIPWCKTHNVRILAYSPMQSGLLTGKFSKQYVESLPDDDWRKRNPLFKEPHLSQTLQFIDQIREIVDKYKTDLGSFSVAWVLSHDAVSSAIVGARNIQQAAAITKGSGWKIQQDHMERIDRIFNEIFNEKSRES